ncbi:MAG: SelT/SelW/SelH family protein [Candidatus Marinimicrobia bacterium]|nr:SelT/SelW/SelH family protein [Candidatus Neomarinimicrobiota bacterium]MBL7023521.1 SelT/SelW/SelH family protein [Candidatus Neomarinimicrobiota bacterium]MBL7109423.1 SelT/SelW/SelH family protein [Candidatus Neomarinimicrobiota bacterium]
MSNTIKSIKPDVEITGNPKPPRSGSFEVETDGVLVFSRLKTNKFPTDSEIKSWF